MPVDQLQHSHSGSHAPLCSSMMFFWKDVTFESPATLTRDVLCFLLISCAIGASSPGGSTAIAPLFRRWRVLQPWVCSKLSSSTNPPMRHHHSWRRNIGGPSFLGLMAKATPNRPSCRWLSFSGLAGVASDSCFSRIPDHASHFSLFNAGRLELCVCC